MLRKLGRLGVVLVIPLAFTLAGCAETVVGNGQIAEGASPTAEPTDDDPSTDFTDDTDSGEFTDDGSGGDSEPADADNGETWLYSDDFELGISNIATYDGGNGIILDGEYAVKITFSAVNNSSAPVDVSGWFFGSGDCEGGAQIADSLDDALNEATGQIAPGQTGSFDEGVAIQTSGAGKKCTIDVTPGSSYDVATFSFTAPGP